MLQLELYARLPRGALRKIGYAQIKNDRTGGDFLANYSVEVWDDENPLRTAAVAGFPRLEAGPWDLVSWALGEALNAAPPPKSRKGQSRSASLVALVRCGRCERTVEIHAAPPDVEAKCPACGSGVVLIRWPHAEYNERHEVEKGSER